MTSILGRSPNSEDVDIWSGSSLGRLNIHPNSSLLFPVTLYTQSISVYRTNLKTMWLFYASYPALDISEAVSREYGLVTT
jgi:hypothetical protein